MMAFDYFYGQEDVEQFLFYRIPKTLITGEEFREVSVEAKLLYGLMLDRLSLSIPISTKTSFSPASHCSVFRISSTLNMVTASFRESPMQSETRAQSIPSGTRSAAN